MERRLHYVAGLHSFSHAHPTDLDLEALKLAAEQALERSWKGRDHLRFRITTRRSNKKFPHRTVEVNEKVGSHLLEKHGSERLTVNLTQPEVDITLELQQERAMVYEGLESGMGGLPVGTGGRLLCLLSGGIDSPVAAYQMLRRGCEVDHIFFENRVFLGRAAYDKVHRLGQVLSRYQAKVRLHVVPFSDIQVAIRDHCSDRNRVVLYRRFMYRMAAEVAKQKGYLGLVNGECLGQVASQTLENIHAADMVADSCIYRPLISMDKVDIMRIARRIETYNISIEDAPDCCSVFMPRRPITRAKVEWLEEDEAKLDMEALVGEALEKMSVETIHWDGS